MKRFAILHVVDVCRPKTRVAAYHEETAAIRRRKVNGRVKCFTTPHTVHRNKIFISLSSFCLLRRRCFSALLNAVAAALFENAISSR